MFKITRYVRCWLLWNSELVTENINLLEHKSISHIALNLSPSWMRYGVPFTNDLDFYNSILFHHLFHHSYFSATVRTSFRQQRQHKLQLPMRQIKFHMWRYSKAIQMTNDNDPSNVYQAKINIHGNAMLWEAFPQHCAEKSLFRQPHRCMMTSSNGNIFRVTGPLCKGQWRGALVFSLICAWTNGWVNNRDAGDLGRHRSHYDVTIMETWNRHDLCTEDT